MRRLKTLKRLTMLYGAVEEKHSLELQQKMAAVSEVKQAIGTEEQTAQSARCHGREALNAGDRMEWAMAEVLRETSDLKRRRLDEIRVVREDLSSAAREQYVASRMKSEQMKRMTDRVAEQMEIEYGRRMQMASDDRFLSRRRWTDAQQEMRADIGIKDR